MPVVIGPRYSIFSPGSSTTVSIGDDPTGVSLVGCQAAIIAPALPSVSG